MITKMTDVCVMVLCGLPGAGKTCFTKQLLTYVGDRPGYQFIVLEYDRLIPADVERHLIHSDSLIPADVERHLIHSDRLIPADVERHLIHSDSLIPADVERHLIHSDSLIPADVERHLIHSDSLIPADVERHLIHSDSHEEKSEWKVYRAGVFKCVDVLVSGLINSTDSIEHNHHQKQKQQSQQQQQNHHPQQQQHLLLHSHLKPADISVELWEKFTISVNESLPFQSLDHGRPKTCIIIDDNMYYKSMRYSFYQVARKYGTGFCQVYVHCDTDTAITQNVMRSDHVTDDIIVTMTTKMEIPDPECNNWECNSLTVTAGQHKMEEVIALIDGAVSNPVQPVQEIDVEAQNQSREICSASILHQSDQVLRKLVSEEMASAKERSLSKQAMRELASALQTARKQLLDNLKSGSIVVPEYIVAMTTGASKDVESELYNFVKAMFNQSKPD